MDLASEKRRRRNLITVRMIYYWNDFCRKEKKERFGSLDELADWIFGQMQTDYSGKDGRESLSFPKCSNSEDIYEITMIPERGGITIWIKLIEDDSLGIVFSDGTFTARRKHCTATVRHWLEECEERRKNPVFNFAADAGEDGEFPGRKAVPIGMLKEAALKIHQTGGCDAADEYAAGYVDAITVALNILMEKTGLTMEEVLDYGEAAGNDGI